MSLSEDAKKFDIDKRIRREVDSNIKLLEKFRRKYPFKANPSLIDNLTPDDLFKVGEDYFFRWIEHTLRPLGSISVGSAAVWRNACKQLEDFKDLLRIAVSDRPLSEKIDAPWEKIIGMGGDKHIAKKIIACYDDNVIPIFKTEHLEHFYDRLVGRLNYPSNYDSMSIGEKYEYLNQALLNLKEKTPETANWDNIYFMKFLYKKYPPPPPQYPKNRPTPEPLNKLGLLFSPTSHDEVMFLFAKLHVKMGFPYIIKIQAEYPDVLVMDNDRSIKRIEIETYASQFNHDPKGCDIIICWENDLPEIPNNWPEIIQLKDYL
ncbi:MAG: hypothetical protein ACTSVW_07285 [Candidatus Njordarchaeales archaeon]